MVFFKSVVCVFCISKIKIDLCNFRGIQWRCRCCGSCDSTIIIHTNNKSSQLQHTHTLIYLKLTDAVDSNCVTVIKSLIKISTHACSCICARVCVWWYDRQMVTLRSDEHWKLTSSPQLWSSPLQMTRCSEGFKVQIAWYLLDLLSNV